MRKGKVYVVTEHKLRILTAAEILGAQDIVREEVPTPEWGDGTGVVVQSMTADQRFAYYQASSITKRDERGIPRAEVRLDWNATVALIVCSVVNEQGEPVFSTDQVEQLGMKNSAVIERIGEVARRLSRLRPQDQEALAAGLKAKNGASPSPSPVTSG